MGKGLLRSLEAAQHGDEVAVRHDEIWLYGDRSRVAFRCALRVTHFELYPAEIGKRFRRMWIDLERTFDGAGRCLVVATLGIHDAQHVQRVELAAVMRQGEIVERLGCREIAGTVCTHGAAERIEHFWRGTT